MDRLLNVNGDKRIIRIGTRKSKLAMIQTETVIGMLRNINGDAYEYEVISMTTTGDHILDVPLSQIGEKSLFTRELEDALLDNKIDCIVHSLKDLPTLLPLGCSIGAVLEREDPNDVIVLNENVKFDDPMDALRVNNVETGIKNSIGTSSLRRIAQLKHLNPNLNITDIRGNLNTRISKLDNKESPYLALILAAAGLKRGGYSSRISHRLCGPKWYHAIGQGAIAVECRDNDQFIKKVLTPLIDETTMYECLAERTLLQVLEGGCSVPIGVYCSWDNTDSYRKLFLHAIVLSLDGSKKVEKILSVDIDDFTTQTAESSPSNYTGISVPYGGEKCGTKYVTTQCKFVNCAKLGNELANSLLDSGAREILDELKQEKMNNV